MIDTRAAMMIIGYLLMIFAIAMGLVGLIDLVAGSSESVVFFLCAAITAFIGAMLSVTNRKKVSALNTKTLFFLISFSWLILSLFCALPFMFSNLQLSFTDALFETVSGLTSMGGTVITGLDYLPPGILLWRSILQWIGGVGVLVMAISALPILRLGGMQIFKMEFAEKIDKAMPRASQLGAWIAGCYVGLTFICVAFYYLAGMTFFDAVNHGMTTLGTGGFSTHDASFNYFNNPMIEWIAVIFMVVGALPFVLFIQTIRGRPLALFKDTQVHWFFYILLFSIISVAIWYMNHNDVGFWEAFRHSSFNMTSMMTGTGYVLGNFDNWGTFVQPYVFILMFIGGCSCSTSCGLKIFRLQVLVISAKAQIKKLLYPHEVVILYYDKQTIEEGVVESVTGFFILYIIIFSIVTAALGATGLDFMSSLSGAVSALACVGPGIGGMIGPAGNFQGLEDSAKWILTASMLIGRLEIFTILVIILPQFWRD